MSQFKVGDWVRTAPVIDPRDYTAEGHAARKCNAIGVIIEEHNSHGLCYDVRHTDWTIGCYDPDELEREGAVFHNYGPVPAPVKYNDECPSLGNYWDR